MNNCVKCERSLALEWADDDLPLCHPCYVEIAATIDPELWVKEREGA